MTTKVHPLICQFIFTQLYFIIIILYTYFLLQHKLGIVLIFIHDSLYQHICFYQPQMTYDNKAVTTLSKF